MRGVTHHLFRISININPQFIFLWMISDSSQSPITLWLQLHHCEIDTLVCIIRKLESSYPKGVCVVICCCSSAVICNVHSPAWMTTEGKTPIQLYVLRTAGTERGDGSLIYIRCLSFELLPSTFEFRFTFGAKVRESL